MSIIQDVFKVKGTKKVTHIKCNECGGNSFTKLPSGDYKCDYCGAFYLVGDYVVETETKLNKKVQSDSSPAKTVKSNFLKVKNPVYSRVLNIISQFLTSNDIPYSVTERFDGWRMSFTWTGGDIACFSGTEDSDIGCVEAYNMPWCSDISILEPEEICNEILKYYNSYVR